jgi:hypothetical protein
MSLPNEADLPDPPLDNTGELLLTIELQSLADRLRRESVTIAESEVPQSAAAPLLRHAAARETRQTWRQVALGVAFVAVCASFAAITIILQHAAELARPLPGRVQPRLNGFVSQEEFGRLAPQAETKEFLSSTDPQSYEQQEIDMAMAAGTLSAQQRIELLEKAIDRYSSALKAQNQKLIELQEELRKAHEELARRNNKE